MIQYEPNIIQCILLSVNIYRLLLCDTVSIGIINSDGRHASIFRELSSLGNMARIGRTQGEATRNCGPSGVGSQKMYKRHNLCRLQLKCDGTRWCTGREVKGKLANGVGSQYFAHYLGTADAHTSAASSQQNSELTPPPIWMDSSISSKDEIWFLRVCHHISTGLYLIHYLITRKILCIVLRSWHSLRRHKVEWQDSIGKQAVLTQLTVEVM